MNCKGSVLIIVLWSLFFLAMLAVAVSFYVMPYVGLSDTLLDKTKMSALAEAGVERAIVEVENDQTEYDCLQDPWSRNEEAFNPADTGNGTFSVIKNGEAAGEALQYGLRDEESKININRVPQAVLKNLLETVAKVDAEKAEEIADSIVDWRDPDDMPEEHGNENDHYHSLPEPYECKNSDFEVPEELLLVAGMTPEIFEKIEDCITVFGEGTVNINTASDKVLMALGMGSALATKLVNFRASGESIAREGESPSGIFMDVASIESLLGQTTSISPEEIVQLQLALPYLGVTSNCFGGRSIGLKNTGVPAGRSEQIEFVYDRKDHIVKLWRERP